MTDVPTFPPLFRGEAAPKGVAPMEKARAAAVMGIDPGLVVYDLTGRELRAALVLAPEARLEAAMAMVFAAALGFSDALGALAPPEVAVHMDWPAGFRVNGARCGRLTADAATRDPEGEPDWLVIGLDVPFEMPEGVEPGTRPEETALFDEGCADITQAQLLESWARHTLYWINRWEAEGMGRLHTDWRGKAFNLGEEVRVSLADGTHAGTFVGLDEAGGILLRQGSETALLPLSRMLP